MFNGDRVPVREDEKVLEMDGGVGCTTMWLYLSRLNCTLINGKMVTLCYVYFTAIFLKSPTVYACGTHVQPHEDMLSAQPPMGARVPIFSRTVPPSRLPAAHGVEAQQISREGMTPLFARRSKGRLDRRDKGEEKNIYTQQKTKQTTLSWNSKALSSDEMESMVGVSSSTSLLAALLGHTIVLPSASTPLM